MFQVLWTDSQVFTIFVLIRG